MGIIGLFPLLKDITCDVHLRSFSGKVAAIDVYCWLHETVVFCVEEIILGIETTRYVSFLRVVKVLDFERKLLFSALLTSDFFQVH